MYGFSYFLVFLLCTNTFSRIIYMCRLRFLFSIWLFLSISSCLSRLISSQASMNGRFIIISSPKISWPVVACNVVWYVICTVKSLSISIPAQGSSSSRYFICKSKVRKRLAITWWIISSIEFACEFM